MGCLRVHILKYLGCKNGLRPTHFVAAENTNKQTNNQETFLFCLSFMIRGVTHIYILEQGNRHLFVVCHVSNHLTDIFWGGKRNWCIAETQGEYYNFKIITFFLIFERIFSYKSRDYSMNHVDIRLRGLITG